MRRLPASLRRIITAFMAMLLTLQSAGSALAVQPESVSLRIAPLNVQIASALQSVSATGIGAILSGDGERWAAMHGPPPIFKHEVPPQIVPPDRHFRDSRQFRSGVFRSGPPMLSRPLNVDEAPKDPRARVKTTHSPIGAPCMRAVRSCASVLLRANEPLQTMSITPTVQPFLFEADTTGAPANLFVTGGAESGAIARAMDPVPAHASANQTLTYTVYSGAMSFGWISPANVPNSTSWPAQTYTVTLNVTQPNANLRITEITLYRVDANGGPGTAGISHVADKAGLSQSLGTAGTLTFSLAGTAQTAAATDRIGVKFIVSNLATTTTSFSYLAGQNSGSGLNLGNAGALSASSTGIKPWWTYEGGALPGQGQYMANVGNGNLLVQATDVDIPERGIDLAFQRTYNAQSTHDSNNADGSVPGDYGDGWTNTFDAHLAYHGTNTISVYDVTGARYDYTADGSGGWTAPAGQHAVLKWDGACGYQWNMKSGTVYYFYSPDLNESANCTLPTVGTYPQDTAYGGRLYKIWGRNSNNYITFSYAWVGNNASNPSNLTTITATHADGHYLTLSFGTQIAGGPTELLSVTRSSDNAVVNYIYDSTTGALLQSVTRPGNNVATLTESYGYTTGRLLSSAASPRYNASASDGDVTSFLYDGSNRLTQTYDWGVVNFEPGTGPFPSDGTGTYLQSPAPASTPLQTWRTITFTGYGSGSTTITDSDGHSATWTIDSVATRVTQTKVFTGEASPTYLLTNQSWDSNNNLTQTVDARGYATEYAYDTNGNLIARALPSVSTSAGTLRPTTLVSYDANNNITAYCDPVSNVNRIWSGSGTPPSCSSGGTVLSWTVTSAEPYGELKSITNPMNDNTETLSYDTGGAQGGTTGVDYGLPTQVQGSGFTQTDGTSITPTRKFTYDAYGDLATYNTGNGTYSFGYDAGHRRNTAIDPDGAATCSWYFADGQMQAMETPPQRAASGASGQCSALASPDATAATFSYDADGNEVSELHHFGNVGGTTNKWYDGEDRLVEVQLPHDPGSFSSTNMPHDYYSNPWMTRYLYDLSQNGTVSFYGKAISTHGGQFDTQEYTGTSPSTESWNEVKGYAYDALGRTTGTLSVAPCGEPQAAHSTAAPYLCTSSVAQTTNSYDTSATEYGLLTTIINPDGNSMGYLHDADANVLSSTYNYPGNPSVSYASYARDPDGRATSVYSANDGTRSYVFNANGDLTQVTEPTTGLSMPAILKYAYYPTGARSSLVVTNESGGASLFNLSYAYRGDGLLQYAQFGYNGALSNFTWAYTAAGRLTSSVDPKSNPDETVTYDTYGRALSESFAASSTTNSNIQYDDEGEPINQNNGTALGFNVRGELLGSITTGLQSANGYLPTAGGPQVTVWGGGGGTTVYDWDARNKVPMGFYTSSSYFNNYSYDGVGLQSSYFADFTTFHDVRTGSTCPQGYDKAGNYTYDAGGHTTAIGWTTRQYPQPVAGQCPGNDYLQSTSASISYVWEPIGHPVLDTQSSVATGAETLHWDGDALLFTSNNNGIDDIKLGTFANDIVVGSTPGLYPIPRDVNSGIEINSNPYDPTGCGTVTDLCESRTDGISDGTVTMQGERLYDVGSGKWTTPDSYQGTPSNPMSGQSYVWNNNNPIMNRDPSGHCPTTEIWGQTTGGSYEDASGNTIEVPPVLSLMSINSVPCDDAEYISSDIVGGSHAVIRYRGWYNSANANTPPPLPLRILKAIASHVYVRVEGYAAYGGSFTTNLCGQAFLAYGGGAAYPFLVNGSVGGGIIWGDPPSVMNNQSWGGSAGPFELGGNQSGVTTGLSLSPNVASLSTMVATQVNNGWCGQ